MLIYIHIPFCKRKCAYCDFCSVASSELEGQYLRALENEIKQAEKTAEKVTSIYFGGGTPSVLKEGGIKRVLDAICESFDVSKDAEISAEGNPESLSLEKLNEWKKAGINRVSIGVQSFQDKVLKEVGRLHDSDMAKTAVKNALEVFENVSIDLMVGLPHQSVEIVRNDVLYAANSGVKHVSCYALKLEDGTKLQKSVENGEVILPDDDKTADMFSAVFDGLKAADFARYEVSNFAKSGYECKHNLGYWKRENYLGFGVSAASLFDDYRFQNTIDLTAYIKVFSDESVGGSLSGNEAVEAEKSVAKSVEKSDVSRLKKNLCCENVLKLSKSDKLFEEIMLGFRLREGVDTKKLNKTYGIDFFKRHQKTLEKYKECFLFDEDRVALSDRGFEIMNMILVEMMD